ncbi:MAG: hypothetical protein GWN00_32890, partial [Aliifodinibius sp.]|nr:hypothetical protein [Fodinibius sp.]NIY29414.1 hypothetical protein [Fodinibius sp.]
MTTVQAQVITTNPEFPVSGESVTITFDATKGNTQLEGYTGDVYAYTGVNTDVADWRHIIADWGENTDKAKMERDPNNPNL